MYSRMWSIEGAIRSLPHLLSNVINRGRVSHLNLDLINVACLVRYPLLGIPSQPPECWNYRWASMPT